MEERKSLIYLASPFSHPDPEIERRRYEAVLAKATELTAAGHLVFCPIVHSYPMHKLGLKGNYETYKEFDERMIEACDVLKVFCLSGWDLSTGITAEVHCAGMLGRPISYIAVQPGEDIPC